MFVKSPFGIAIALLLTVALVFSSPIKAQDAADTVRLTLAQIRDRALVANPELVAGQLNTAIASGEARQAGVFMFNPTFELLGPGGGNATQPAISQELEVFGQRDARTNVARKGYARAVAEHANLLRLTLGDVDRAFYRLVAAMRRTKLADDILLLNERLSAVAQRQLAEGEISRLDFNLATIETGRAQSRALAAHREVQGTTIELDRAIGLPIGTSVLPVSDPAQSGAALLTSVTRIDAGSPNGRQSVLDVDSLTKLALRTRPDLSASVAATDEALARASLSRREAFPNLIVRAVWQRSADERQGQLSPGFGISVPLFNRNQGEVQARRASASQAQLAHKALVARIRAQVATAAAAYTSAAQEAAVLESTVLAPAQQNRQLLEIAYREGKVGLPVLILIRNQVNDAELEYWAAWLAEREAFVTLSEVTGEYTTLSADPSR